MPKKLLLGNWNGLGGSMIALERISRTL